MKGMQKSKDPGNHILFQNAYIVQTVHSFYFCMNAFITSYMHG